MSGHIVMKSGLLHVCADSNKEVLSCSFFEELQYKASREILVKAIYLTHVDAVMAQRKGELLKLGILEKLAGLKVDIQKALDSMS